MRMSFCRRTVMATAIAACFPGMVFGAGVARVDFAAGSVSAIGADGRSRALTKGSEIEVGETVSTQAGRAQLRFADGAYMSLQPQTEFKVEEFRYAGKPDGSENIVMNLIKGGMRTITGLIGRTNRNAYRLKTDVATIGIRGTEYSVRYTNSIELFCADGAVVVDNQSGSFVVTGGTGVHVSNQQSPPQQTEQKPVLPPESPVQEQDKQTTQQPPAPPQPFQQTQQTLLTGTVTGYWAVSFPGNSNPFSSLQDSSDPVSITLDGSGKLVSLVDVFEGGITGSSTVGSASASSHGNDGIIAWGRWAGGTTGGNGRFSNINLADPFEGPLHYIVGLPATNIPTMGTATYQMMGHSSSSLAGPVAVTSSSLNLDFASSSATFHGQFSVAGSSVGTDPGGIGINRSGAHMQGSGFLGFCGPQIRLQGFLAGDGAPRAGMAYSFFLSDAVNGVIAYKRQ
jgi:hypothetical protein